MNDVVRCTITWLIEVSNVVSVVITTSAREPMNETLDSVDSVQNQSCSPKEVILVVEGGGSVLKRYEGLSNSTVRVVQSTGIGLSAGRNTGMLCANGDIVAFIDDDAVADPDWLRNLIKNFYEPAVLGAGGRIVAVFPETRPSWFPHELDWMLGCTYEGHPMERCDARNLIGCNMSFRRDALLSVGGFPTFLGRRGTSLVGSEEAALAIALRQRYPRGCIIFDPEAVVYHKISPWKTNFSFMIRRSFFEGYSKAIVARLFGHKSLSSERRYIRQMLCRSKLRNRCTRAYLIEYAGIVYSTYAVALGYAFGWLSAKTVTRQTNSVTGPERDSPVA
jgi:glycosyltransferase involved in cell wall biosynthesis